jgi:hypothetical protein
VPEIKQNEEIIEGEKRQPKIITKDHTREDAAVDAIKDDEKITIDGGIEDPRPQKNKIKIPDFGKARKWIIAGVCVGVALIGLLVWLIFFATKLTINIEAETKDVKIDQPVFLVNGGANLDESQLKLATVEPVRVAKEIEFDATGSRQVGGAKATGTTKVKCTRGAGDRCGTLTSIGVYSINKIDGIAGGSDVSATLTAPDIGARHNQTSYRTDLGLGYEMTPVDIAGGVDSTTEKFVQQSDIDGAKSQILQSAQSSSDEVKRNIEGKFGEGVRVIDGSLKAVVADEISNPALDKKSDDKAKLSANVVYTMAGVGEGDLRVMLNALAEKKITGGGKDQQGVFDDGYDALEILSFQWADGGGSVATARLKTIAKIGPKIDENELREYAAGKKRYEIEKYLEKIGGIKKAEVKFFPFWVSKVADADKIKIKKIGL